MSSRSTDWGRTGSCVCIECFGAGKVYHIQLQSKMVKDKRLIKETADYNDPVIITKYFTIVFAGKSYKINNLIICLRNCAYTVFGSSWVFLQTPLQVQSKSVVNSGSTYIISILIVQHVLVKTTDQLKQLTEQRL